MEDLARLTELITSLLPAGRRDRLTQVLEEERPADLASVLRELPVEQQVEILRLVPRDRAAEIFAELDDQTLLGLVEGLEEREVSTILEHMAPEDAAEVVNELPGEQAERLLELMEEDKSEDVQELLEYPEGTAGRLMSPHVLAVSEESTVAEVIERIRAAAPQDAHFTVYVVDHHRHLVGVAPLRRLLVSDPSTPVRLIRHADVITVTPETDQEEVARLVARYDLPSVPVVDRGGRLLGTISVDDVIDVLGKEASEDIFRMAGSDAAELEQRSPRQIALLRLPWVLATLFIELLAGVVIHYYDETLGRVILLASFMPVIQAISGNTGLQSVTMVVRGLATGHVRLDRWWEPLLRQVQTTSLIGAVCGIVVGIVGVLWHRTLAFGLVVAVSMFISVNLSGLAGTGIPMVSKRLGFDPALTAGPFETAFQDVVGVTIFLSLATLLLRWLG